jgi:hypothetical protein
MSVPSLALGGRVIAASNAVLQASLSSAFFSRRHAVICSAFGMNALQSLKASGVHAFLVVSVPCENEGEGKNVADSKASDTYHRARDVGRKIRSFRFSILVT